MIDTAIVTNGFFVNKKTEEIRMLLIKAFEVRGVDIISLRNDECINTDRVASLGLKKVLFWDKDVVLCKSLELLGLKVVNCSQAIMTCDDKSLTYLAAKKAGIPTPKTLVAPFTYSNIGLDRLDFVDEAISVIGLPMVIKECHGSFGMQVHLAKSREDAVRIIRGIAPRPFIFQEYIECGNSDLRLQVVDGKVVAAVRRSSTDGDFRANATLGGRMTPYSPSRAECALAEEAAKAVGASIAGVDVLKGDKDYLCEVNCNAHFKRLTEATGTDVAGIIADYIISL